MSNPIVPLSIPGASPPAPATPELDRGGWARLDISDLNDLSEMNETETDRAENGISGSSAASCGWCAEETASGEYLVVADNQNYQVCPTCWGRSPGYVELRSAGWTHEASLARVIGQAV